MDRPVIASGVRVARVNEKDTPSLVLQRVARIRPHSNLDSKFALLLLGGRSFAEYLAPIFTGISVPHVSPDQIGAFRIGLPDTAEQSQIVKWARVVTAKLETSMVSARREVKLIREFRTRLIADVVTGKVDVRGVELPEVDEEEEVGNGKENDVDEFDSPASEEALEDAHEE